MTLATSQDSNCYAPSTLLPSGQRSDAAFSWCDQSTPAMVRSEDAMESREIDPRLWHESRQSGNEVNGFECYLGRSVPVRRLQSPFINLNNTVKRALTYSSPNRLPPGYPRPNQPTIAAYPAARDESPQHKTLYTEPNLH